MRWLKRAGLGLAALLVLAVAGFLIWAYTPLGPMPEAVAALQSDGQVQVSTAPWYVFRPAGVAAAADAPLTGFIFYPGGRVDARSYAPSARALAVQGYLVVIVPMPLNLAVLGSNRAADVISAFPEVQRWAIGGHSLGGAMAAQFAYSHPGRVQGLALWAAYPPDGADISGSHIQALSIYGSDDGVVQRAKLSASRALLPASTRWVVIEGGNHAQFGYYGLQPGDRTAAIDRAAQQSQAVTATAALLSALPPVGQ